MVPNVAMGLEYLSTFTINSCHSWIGKRPSPWGTHIWHIFCEKKCILNLHTLQYAWRSHRKSMAFLAFFGGRDRLHETPIQTTHHVEGTWQKITTHWHMGSLFHLPNIGPIWWSKPRTTGSIFICWSAFASQNHAKLKKNIGYMGHISSHSPTCGLIFDLCGKYT